MNFERAKSIILIVLVGTSIFLTWSIWTYEPKYEKIDQGNYINIESDEQTVSDIIKPKQILIHRNNQHFQASDQVDIEKAEKQMAEWKLYNLTRHSSQLTKEQFEDVVMQMERLKLYFQMIFHYPCIRLHFISGIKKCQPFHLIELYISKKISNPGKLLFILLHPKI